MSLQLPARLWTESEGSFGNRPDGYTVHRDEATAAAFVAAYWAREKERNPGGRIPEIYSYASDESVMVDVSQDLYDEVMEKGSVWAHVTSHGAQHARDWKKPVEA